MKGKGSRADGVRKTAVEPRAKSASQSRWRRWLPYGLLVGVVLVVYANTLGNGLVYDDKQILLSPLIHDPWNLGAVFSNRFYAQIDQDVELYRPLTNFGYLVNYRVNEIVAGSGESAAGFHLVGLLMHALVACSSYAWLVSLRLERNIALSAALVFAVLPIHSEVVASVYNRSDAQAAFFGLAFLLSHRRGAWILAILAYLLAAWSKESAITFLPLAIATDYFAPVQFANGAVRGVRTNVNRYAAYAAVAALWFVMRAEALSGVERSTLVIENPLRAASIVERVLTAGRVQWDYLLLQLVPIQLSTDYSLRQIPIVTSWLEPRFLGFVALLAAAIAIVWLARKRAPIVSLAIVGYAIAFSATSNFLAPIGTIMGERLAYAPSLFTCVLIAFVVWSAHPRIGSRASIATVSVLCIVYAAKSFAQNRVWRDELALFAEQVRTAPNSAKAHLNYGCALDVEAIGLENQAAIAGREGRAAEQQSLQAAALERHRLALAQYEQSAAIYDQYAQTHYLIGNALHALKEPWDKVIAAYRTALRVDPGHADVRVNLAAALIEAKRFDEARAVVRELVALDPLHPSLPALQRRLASEPP